MTEFAETAMRHYCRNPKCRMRLPAPVSNEREAFCKRGCYSSFYLHRCRVCEKRIEQSKYTTRLICKKSKCRNAWEARAGFGRYAEPPGRDGSQEVPANGALLSGVKATGSAWKQSAGRLSDSQFHCAALGGSAMDEVLRIEAKNRAALKAHCAAPEAAEIAGAGEFTEPEWREVISPDGVRCFATPNKRVIAKITTELSADWLPADLFIPEFLRRR
jgi:hypothetical protein